MSPPNAKGRGRRCGLPFGNPSPPATRNLIYFRKYTLTTKIYQVYTTRVPRFVGFDAVRQRAFFLPPTGKKSATIIRNIRQKGNNIETTCTHTQKNNHLNTGKNDKNNKNKEKI